MPDDSQQMSLPLGVDYGVQVRDERFGVSLLALSMVDGLGHKGIVALMMKLSGPLSEVWKLPAVEVASILSAVRVPAYQQVAAVISSQRDELLDRGHRELERIASKGVTLLGPGELPSRLANIKDGPRWLFVEGNVGALDQPPFVAVVGTRDPSPSGVRATEAVVRSMAAYQVSLVSGLANGIDAAAHDHSLRFGLSNVAFLGHGIDVVFPSETAHLRRRIVAKGGAVASEYLPKDNYRKQYFVARNRLQAALADVVVAADGKANGGTAHTVRFASKYGRPIVGLRFDGAGDLNDLVIDQPDSRILNVFEPSERKVLDSMFRQLANQAGHATNALSLVADLLQREANSRTVTPADVKLLQIQLDAIGKEAQ